MLHIPVFRAHENKITVGQVGVCLGQDFLLTTHTSPCTTISEMLAHCANHPSQTGELFIEGAAYLLYKFISNILADVLAMTEKVETELDVIEGLAFDNDTYDAQRIGRARRKIVVLRQIIGPKRFLLQDLAEQ